MHNEKHSSLEVSQFEVLRSLSADNWLFFSSNASQFTEHSRYADVLCLDSFCIHTGSGRTLFSKQYEDVPLNQNDFYEIRKIKLDKINDPNVNSSIEQDSLKFFNIFNINSADNLHHFLKGKKAITRVLSCDEVISDAGLTYKIYYDVGFIFSFGEVSVLVCFLGVEYRIVVTFNQESIRQILDGWTILSELMIET